MPITDGDHGTTSGSTTGRKAASRASHASTRGLLPGRPASQAASCRQYVSVLDVARRDGWACSECGEPVPQRWTADELGRAPVLAFTVPLAEGGRYTEDGVRLAHLGGTGSVTPRSR